ncbi:MAG: TIM barrel protein [Clostridia bacterium]|nr:TIM barrel protein [Clostridia bacterium]MBP3360237.1 TIM barrel protein [Clostridia bacterium]
MKANFGAAGNSDSFYAQGHKASEEMPKWLREFGLNAYEYQCGNGVRCGEATARKIAAEAAENNIIMSVHSPYYINLATPDEEKRAGGINYILQSAQLAKYLGGERVVVHSGAIGKMERAEALEYAKKTLLLARQEMINGGFENIRLCIETMGKINQLGNLDEVMELCRLDESFLPCIDFGHLNARTLGGLKTKADFEVIFDAIENKLGIERLKVFHSHFSKIEYTKGGEKKHLTFSDTVFGPDFDFVAEVMAQRDIGPTIICESAGTQAEDALAMKKIYEAIAK